MLRGQRNLLITMREKRSKRDKEGGPAGSKHSVSIDTRKADARNSSSSWDDDRDEEIPFLRHHGDDLEEGDGRGSDAASATRSQVSAHAGCDV